MKKIVISVLLILLVAIGCIYVFIPNNISFNESLLVKVNRDGLSRNLYDETKWNTWWPGNIDKNNGQTHFIYNNSYYSVEKKTFGSILISVENKNIQANTVLSLINKNYDTTVLVWGGVIPTSYNPIKRVQIYLGSRLITKDNRNVLNKIQAFFSKIENVYGYHLKEVSVVDSVLISTYKMSNGYPSIAFSYELIEQLKKYIADNGAKETGYPMLNINTTDSIQYLTRVAIPINKRIANSDNIFLKLMPGGGNILVVDVKGGPSSVNDAFKSMGNYLIDYHLSSPAIPFFSLITDRRKEPDTSKWMTRIYYPFM